MARLNRHLQPHMMDLALDITGLERDDLLPQEQRAHRRPGLVLPEHGPGIALTVSQMQMLPVPIRVRTPTKNGQWLVSPLAVQLLKQPDPHGTSSVKSA